MARQIEILPAGETGPRRLDATTVMKVQGVPFLTISEFIRAKLKSWTMYAFFICCQVFINHVSLLAEAWTATHRTSLISSIVTGIVSTSIEYLNKT